MAGEQFDAVIVGAGFAGIYQLYRLLRAGLRCLVIEEGGGCGGTWYWNLYPGAMSDTESYTYRFSWDREDLLKYEWNEHYVKQPEVLAYLNHVTDKHGLRPYMRFNTRLTGADWSESSKTWNVTVNDDEQIQSRYLITALGLLSTTNRPNIPGIDSFEGGLYHTGKWPKDCDLTGKRVGVIGNGSTGVQVITDIGRKVKQLDCYQRHPQYSVPSGDRPFTAEDRKWVNENWDNIIHTVRNSITAFGFEESQISYHDVTPDDRERIFQEAWDKGNGFRFMFATFNDISTDAEANEGAADFIRRKIDQMVKDPEKARKLKPYDVYARRPLCDGNASNNQKYFEQFNHEHVDIVDLKETPIEMIEAKGIRTTDGQFREHDVIVLATGFDAVEGGYTRIAIHGRDSVSLKDYWDDKGPTSYLGLAIPEFPNFFMVSGPKGPFTNNPPAIEVQVEFIGDAIEAADANGRAIIEATHEAEEDYSKLCEKLAAKSLFWKAADNWIFGANIEGKRRCLRFFFGGMKAYREVLLECRAKGFQGFKPFTKNGAAASAML